MLFSKKKNAPSPARPKIDGKSPSKRKKTPPPIASKTLSETPSFISRFNNLASVVHDSIWALVVIFTSLFAVALATFRMIDPAWSRSIKKMGEVQNLGGLFGAYVSDIGYYLLGLSVWWFVVAAFVWLYKNFRWIQQRSEHEYSPIYGGMGLGLLILCSPILEKLYFKERLNDVLPRGAGGLVGDLLADGLELFLGSVGSILILIAIILVGMKLLMQFAYLDVFLAIGRNLKQTWHYIIEQNQEDEMVARPEQQSVTRSLSQKAREIIGKPVENPASANSNRQNKLQATSQDIETEEFLTESVVEYDLPNDGTYRLPDVHILRSPRPQTVEISTEDLQRTADQITEKFKEFNINVQVIDATVGPVITRFEIEPAKGVKGSQIVGLSKDLARSLALQSVRVVETIVGKNTMGIELPNEERQDVVLKEIFSSSVFADATSKLTVAIGKDISGSPTVGDLAKMPHLLVGGMTGSGKSVGVNAMILSILFKAKPDEVRFIMIDPKMLELSVYEGIPHLLCPVVTDMKEAGNALNWCVAEMEKRYRLLSHLGVRNLMGFNEKIDAAKKEEKSIPNPFSLNPDEPEPLEKLPQIVVVIDELADLMMTEKKAVETQIARLAQKARAAGIHMIIATQRPSVDVITGLIKANVPTRMAFTVQSRIDSRTILDQMGAEDLLKNGDLLFLQPGQAEPTRLQGAFVSDDEVHQVVDFIKKQAEPNYIEGILTGEATIASQQRIQGSVKEHSDELFNQAVDFILDSRKTSISALQRHLHIGYNRAANLMQVLEEEGIVSRAESNGARQILVHREEDS